MSRPASSIVERAERFVERPDISARSLLVTVWGDTIAPLTETVWLSELFALLEPLPYNERLLRTSLSRLQNDDWVSAQRDGRRSRYELTESAQAQTLEAESRIYGDRPARSDGRWQLVISDQAPPPDDLRSAGYATLGPTLYGRPLPQSSAPEADTVELPDSTADAVALFDSTAAAVTLFDSTAAAVTLFDSTAAAVAMATFTTPFPPGGIDGVFDAFDLRDVASDYERFIADYGPLLPKQVAKLEPSDAFALRTMMMHEFRRIRLRDPLVPRDVLDNDWVGDRARNVAAALYQAVLPASWRWAAKTLDAPDRPNATYVASRLTVATD